MPRIPPTNPETATGQAKALLDGVQEQFGMVPNLVRTLAQSPAVLEAYLASSAALATGSLPPGLREQIALTVSEANGCAYCVAAHGAICKMVGLSDEAILDTRSGRACDSHTAAALAFARRIVDTQGWVSDTDLATVRGAGFDDAAIVEIVAIVAQTTFTNYINHVAETEVDFPPAADMATPQAT